MTSPTPMPVRVGVRLAHATIQVLAEQARIDVLHIKGPAVNAALLAPCLDQCAAEAPSTEAAVVERSSVDADVLVRPEQVHTLISTMLHHGWSLTVDFADGSSFEHAATLNHPQLAPVDVHRSFPGFGSEASAIFEVLWSARTRVDIAGYGCWVPDVTAQRLILLLNAVRGGPHRRDEIEFLWGGASQSEREAVLRLASRTGASVALAAATGNLQDYSNHREYDLWRMLSSGGGSLVGLWWARVRAQPTLTGAIREATKRLLPNARRLAVQLGRPVTRREVVAAWGQRLSRAMRALGAALISAASRGNR